MSLNEVLRSKLRGGSIPQKPFARFARSLLSQQARGIKPAEIKIEHGLTDRSPSGRVENHDA